MDRQWEKFLGEAGAVIRAGRVEDFGQLQKEKQAVIDGNIIADLSHHALIRANGEDAASFLQGQLTNDIRLLDAAHSQLSAYCNAQGRMLAIFRVFLRSGDFMLQLPASLQHTLIARLRMYVLRSKVALTPVDDELSCIGLAGVNAEDILRVTVGAVPENVNEVAVRQDVSVLRLTGVQPRFQLVAARAALFDLWRSVSQRATPVGAACWAWLDIMAGVPTIYPQTTEAFVPQMTNLELLDGVNFSKGCYSGQEIVARVQYLGQLKQRMYRLHAATQRPPLPGEAIYAPGLGQPAGTVVDAQPSPRAGCDLLAVVHVGSAAAGKLYLGDAPQTPLTIEPLPYPLLGNG